MGLVLSILGILVILILLKPNDIWYPLSYTNLGSDNGSHYYSITYINLRNSELKSKVMNGRMSDEIFTAMKETFKARYKQD